MDAPEDVAPRYFPYPLYSSLSVRRKSESRERQTVPQGTVMVLSIHSVSMCLMYIIYTSCYTIIGSTLLLKGVDEPLRGFDNSAFNNARGTPRCACAFRLRRDRFSRVR